VPTFGAKTFAPKVGTLVDNAIAKLIQRMQSPKGTYEKRLPCGQCFCTAQTMVQPLQAEKRLTCGMSNGTWTHSELILTQTAVQLQFAAQSAAQWQQTSAITHCFNLQFFFAHCFFLILSSSWLCGSWINMVKSWSAGRT
jgi:hypothetical protein